MCAPGYSGLDCSISLEACAWADEFEGPALDTRLWQPYIGCRGGGNGEAECYTDQPDNVFTRDGMLALRAVREDWPGTRTNCTDPNPVWCLNGGTFRSGRVDSRRGLLYGRVEVRARMPARPLAWPALWMAPVEQLYGYWPRSGEIDIAEVRGGEQANETFGTIHFGRDWQHHAWLEGSTRPADGRPLSNAVHTYALEWTQRAIEWSLDGTTFHHQRTDGCFPGESAPGKPFDIPMRLILNLAVGGNFFAGFDARSFDADALAERWPGGSAELLVHSVRVFEADALARPWHPAVPPAAARSTVPGRHVDATAVAALITVSVMLRVALRLACRACARRAAELSARGHGVVVAEDAETAGPGDDESLETAAEEAAPGAHNLHHQAGAAALQEPLLGAGSGAASAYAAAGSAPAGRFR